jgi:cytochrome c peroxidase
MPSTLCAATLTLGAVLSLACSEGPAAPEARADAGSDASAPQTELTADLRAELEALALPEVRVVRPDVTNAYADDAEAAKLGQKFFFDPRFSGPLLDEANNGFADTLGLVGETGKVACASCHMPGNGAFVDTRSARQQLSFASGWTHRKAPSLLDVAEATFLTWSGRRDTAYSQVFGPIESPLEFNSSRLYVAQQIERLYKTEYEAVFGSMPALDTFAELAPEAAGCTAMPVDAASTICQVPGADDEAVTRVVVNFGKAIQAYTRQLTCGPSRFDAWIRGDESALTPEEQLGAIVFVGKGACNECHSGPQLTNHRFYNLGVPGGLVPFTGVNTADDPGAAEGLALVREDWLNSRGIFSDGDDGRLDTIAGDLSGYAGTFRTPTLRCVGRRPSFMHNAEFRSLEDVSRFFSKGEGDFAEGYVGTPTNYVRDLLPEEVDHLIAFLRALDGSGPAPELTTPPQLP